MADPPLTLLEVAERYRFNERKLRRIIRKHSLPVLRDGHDIRFDALALSALDKALRPLDSKISAATAAKLRADELLKPAEKEDEPGVCVYFIATDETIKIGRSKDPGARLAALQISSSAPLTLLGYIPGGSRTERRIQRQFARHRIRGEWFHRAEEIIDFIEARKIRHRGR